MTDSPRRPRKTVSPERKGLYLAGLGLQVLGGIGVLVCFLGFVTGARKDVESMGQEGSPMQWWLGVVTSTVALGVGGMTRKVAARGIAGSGLVLDPERARDDLEPWARTGGGLLEDALDEARLGRGEAGEGQTVVVRCPRCRTLNDEDAKFCDHCGAAL